MEVSKLDAFSPSRVQKRPNRRPRNSGSTNNMRQQPRRGSHAESSSSREDHQSNSSLQAPIKGPQPNMCTICEPTKTGPQPQYASRLQEEFCRQQSFIQALHMQNNHLLKENESLKLQIQELNLQIQVQTVSFALQIPELQSSIPAQLLTDRAFMVPPKTMPLSQTATMNNMRTPYMGGESMMAMKSLQMTNGGCGWEEIW